GPARHSRRTRRFLDAPEARRARARRPMTAWGLAWRTIARSPARSVLAVSGVTVIGALLFNMLLLSRGLLVSFRDLLDTAGFDIRVVAADGSMVHRPPIGGASPLAGAIARL